MKKFLFNMILACITCLGFASYGYERVDAGCEGILVNLYGDDKGVGDVSLCTGAVWYNWFTQAVYEYPTYVQTIDYAPFTTTSKEGSTFTLDPSVLVKIKDGKSPAVFKKYRKSMNELDSTVIQKLVRDACRLEINKYNTDYIVSNREVVENAIEKHLGYLLNKENFELIGLTTGLDYPTSIKEAINAKTKAIQDAQRAQNELAVAEAEARKKVIAAQAEADANKLRQMSLTPLLIQQQYIQKWDGHLPEVTGGSNMMFTLPTK